MIETIKKHLDDSEIVCGVFIGLKKAFDTVKQEIIFEKLKHYEIRRKHNDWIQSFLSNRKEYVSIEGFFFQTKFVKCGVPQGSTSGPLYFLICSNGPTDALEKFIVHHFTKDWPRANKLSLNESKTKLLHLVN